MARAYSQDLRDRVIDAALGGMPARRAAAQFEIGIATAMCGEMQQRLATERGIKASVGTIWTFLDRCGLTFKKSPRTRRSGIGPTS